MLDHVTPVASCGVRYWASVRNRWSDWKRHTAQTVLSHRVSSMAEPGDVLSFSGVSTRISRHVSGAPNSFPTTSSSDSVYGGCGFGNTWCGRD